MAELSNTGNKLARNQPLERRVLRITPLRVTFDSKARHIRHEMEIEVNPRLATDRSGIKLARNRRKAAIINHDGRALRKYREY